MSAICTNIIDRPDKITHHQRQLAASLAGQRSTSRDRRPLYRELREMGPAVWLEKYRMFALTRYDAVVRVLRDWEAFPSSLGVMMNDDMNQVLRGNTLCSDGDAHNRLRRVVIRPVTPVALKSLEDEVEREAEAIVDRLCARGNSARPPSLQPICR